MSKSLPVEEIDDLLKPRVEVFKNAVEPFGKPSAASKKLLQAGSIDLLDGTKLTADAVDREFVEAISKRFDIDEVQALILLRSFLYNEGLPLSLSSEESRVDELVEAITPFYYSERIFILRTVIPLLRAVENEGDPLHTIASAYIAKCLPDSQKFAQSLVHEYTERTHRELPSYMNGNPRTASTWAKQNLKEELVILELLFWTMWSYASCDGPTVLGIFEAAYRTQYGAAQLNSMLLLDTEGAQLQQDIASIWIVLTVEVLELERVASPKGIDISEQPKDRKIYTASPEALSKIHALVIGHEDSKYACTYLAWAFVLSQLAAAVPSDIPKAYRSFYEEILPHLKRSSKQREPTHALMARLCLEPSAGLFELMLNLLTGSSLFVTSIAWSAGSNVTDPNAIAFRSVMKGLIIALVEMIPVEMIPDFDTFVEVWISLFGRSESHSVAGICHQFWTSDWQRGLARRAILDVARARFPIQPMPLIKLLRALSAAGFLETDPLSTAKYVDDGLGLENETRDECAQYVFKYMDTLPTFSQIVQANQCTGAHALYERVQERPGSFMASTGVIYQNLKTLALPGGGTLPMRSTGRLLGADSSEAFAIAWDYEHSGWRILVTILTEYVKSKQIYANAAEGSIVSSFDRNNDHIRRLGLQDIGVTIDEDNAEALVTAVLDLIRSTIQDNHALTHSLMVSLENPSSVVPTSIDEPTPDLVQLSTMILEGALSRAGVGNQRDPPIRLISSAMSVLSSLLALPDYSTRVWLYVRSTSSLFGAHRSTGFASKALAAERAKGQYTMTLSLLHFVACLFQEASLSSMDTRVNQARLQELKLEVLGRALQFVHTEIWVEHSSWRYAHVGDKFEIARRTTSLFTAVITQIPASASDLPLASLSTNIIRQFLSHAATSTVNPLVAGVTTAGHVLRSLFHSRRYGDARTLILLLQSHLNLIRLLLHHKHRSASNEHATLLEQTLSTSFIGPDRSKLEPLEVIASFVRERDFGIDVPTEAARVLSTMCVTFASCRPALNSILGHWRNPEIILFSFVRIIKHPYDDMTLREAVWSFLSTAIQHEPGLAKAISADNLISTKKAVDHGSLAKDTVTRKGNLGATDVARELLSGWRDLWTANPQLLASVMTFMTALWSHGLEHKSVIQGFQNDGELWEILNAVVKEELGPFPDYKFDHTTVEGITGRSTLQEGVMLYAYRARAKAEILQLVGHDIAMHQHLQSQQSPPAKSASFGAILNCLRSIDDMNDLLAEATATPYDPDIYDNFLTSMTSKCSAFRLDHIPTLQSDPDRGYGGYFRYSPQLLRDRLDLVIDSSSVVSEQELVSLNLNLSLMHSHDCLIKAWRAFLRQTIAAARLDPKVRSMALAASGPLALAFAQELRTGDVMVEVHSDRLEILRVLLEVAWFAPSNAAQETKSVMVLLQGVQRLLLCEAFPPMRSLLALTRAPYHRPLLHVVFYCATTCSKLITGSPAIAVGQRQLLSSMLDTTLQFTVNALRVVFGSARTRLDSTLDSDMELIVAVFAQVTRLDLNRNTSQWLALCQETDVLQGSLALFSEMDLVGLTDEAFLRNNNRPLYVAHVISFHTAIAAVPAAAERLLGAGVLSAYANNGLSSAIAAGLIDPTIPELPGARSPAHIAWCAMLAVSAGVISNPGRHDQSFEVQACGIIQLYGDQIHRTLSWTVSDPVTFPWLEELEETLQYFQALSTHAVRGKENSHAVSTVLRGFTGYALPLLQQLNYALTHPNHLSSLLESTTETERRRMQQEPREGPTLGSSVSIAADSLKLPLTALLMKRFLALATLIMHTLCNVSQAETVLLGDSQEWNSAEAVIIPHSKVVLSEPASVGTLMELGNCSLDILQNLIPRRADERVATAIGDDEPILVKDVVAAARQALEMLLLYGVTQLAIWTSREDFEHGDDTGDADATESQAPLPRSNAREQRIRQARASTGAPTDRTRRTFAGDVVSEFYAMLSKAQPIMSKSDALRGTVTGDLVDLPAALSHFMRSSVLM